MIYRACVSSVLTRGIGKDRKLLVYDDDDVASCLPVLFQIKAMFCSLFGCRDVVSNVLLMLMPMLMHTGFNVPMSASDGRQRVWPALMLPVSLWAV